MSGLKTEDIRFDSANGSDQVAGYFFTEPGVEPKAILQISHGMCEYIGRYRDFAAFMARNGFAVCGNDHLGHGATSGGGLDGYFAPQDGRRYVLRDLKTMNELARRKWPGLPLVFLGHSMGSFFARKFAAEYPDALDALVISGTGGPNPVSGVGKFVTSLLIKLKGGKARSALVQKLAFGAYLDRIEAPATPYDWISKDPEIVAAYAKDPKCTFTFTLSAFKELVSIQQEVNQPGWAASLKKDTPVYLFSGDMDPVGDYGRGVRKVYESLRAAGVRDVQLKLYAGGRHEMLNEAERAQVYEDVLAWCRAHV